MKEDGCCVEERYKFLLMGSFAILILIVVFYLLSKFEINIWRT